VLAGWLTAKLFKDGSRHRLVLLALVGLLIGLSVNLRLPNLFLSAGYCLYLAGAFLLARNRETFLQGAAFGVAFLIGFRSDAGPLGWLAAGGILLLFIVAVSWLAALVGLLARSPEAANGFTFFLMFLPYASSAFVPIDTMPVWLQGFSGHQPVTPVIESVRGLLAGTPVGNSPWLAIAWCGGIAVGSALLSVVAFRRRTS